MYVHYSAGTSDALIPFTDHLFHGLKVTIKLASINWNPQEPFKDKWFVSEIMMTEIFSCLKLVNEYRISAHCVLFSVSCLQH